MDDRKKFILSAILQSYIREGEPIGSRTVRREYQMDISAATIRNEMSDLEHEGYLQKAHTSSGRIPAEKAYRWYVNELMKRGIEANEIPALGSRTLLKGSHDPEHLIPLALEILSDLTGNVAFALIPGRTENTIDKIRLIPLSGHEIMVVCIFDTKEVQTELIHLDREYGLNRLERMGLIFQELLENRKLSVVLSFLESDYFSGAYVKGNLVSELVPVLEDRLQQASVPRVIFRGIGKWFRDTDPEGASEAFALLQEVQVDPEFLRVLMEFDPKEGTTVRIGSENELSTLKKAALITTPYVVHSDKVGILGVIGPLRMHYAKVIADVHRMGKYLDSITRRL